MKTTTTIAPPPDHSLDMEVLRQFRMIFKSVRKHFQSIEDKLGISGSLLWALSAVANTPGISVTALAQSMSVHQSTASNIIAKLVELDFVRKERTETDSRVTGLFVTPHGEEQLHQAPGPVRGLLPDALDKLPYRTLRDLNQNLQVLLEQMEALEAQGSETPLADI
ncbi:MAG: MarR family transcriptional regulator [Formivibrio sp.]|nr:MarR family transcriptional regulator [Formivibrio sp.]